MVPQAPDRLDLLSKILLQQENILHQGKAQTDGDFQHIQVTKCSKVDRGIDTEVESSNNCLVLSVPRQSGNHQHQLVEGTNLNPSAEIRAVQLSQEIRRSEIANLVSDDLISDLPAVSRRIESPSLYPSICAMPFEGDKIHQKVLIQVLSSLRTRAQKPVRKEEGVFHQGSSHSLHQQHILSAWSITRACYSTKNHVSIQAFGQRACEDI